MDPLTDVFRSMQVRAAIQCRLEATAPWGLAHVAPGRDLHVRKLAGLGITYAETASFAMVLRGNCWLTVDGIPDPMPLATGDCYFVAPGKSYALRDHPRTPALNFGEAVEYPEDHVVHYGGGGAPTTIIAGLICFEKVSLKSIVQLLPDFMLIRAEQARSLELHTTFQLLAAEMNGLAPGYEAVSTRLAEILFVKALRVQISDVPDSRNPGWLRAIFHPQIGAALREFHANVADPWTVESLAFAAGMSRSAFAVRFKQLLRKSPLEYVTEWRMQKAIQLLGDGDRKLIDIAQRIGYESDAAFNKAFKRVLGNSPREYIRQTVSRR